MYCLRSFFPIFHLPIALSSVLVFIFALSFTACDSPSEGISKQGESPEELADNVVTAESMGYEITITDLGTLSGKGHSQANAINDSGQIVGSSYHAHNDRVEAVLWQDAKIRPLCNLLNFDSGSDAFSINNAGQILVRLILESKSDKYYLVENDELTPINGLERVYSINDSGQIAGIADGKAAVWKDGEVKIFNDEGIKSSIARRISNSGIVAGGSTDAITDSAEATIWKNGNIIRLGTLSSFQNDYGLAYDVNEKEQVVGFTGGILNSSRAFIWEDGVMAYLGGLGGFGSSRAFSINNLGQIVGNSVEGEAGNRNAVLWIDSRIVELKTLVKEELKVSSASDINNNGQIAGRSNTPSGDTHAVLWDIKKIK